MRSPEANQITTDTPQALSWDSNANSGGDSNAIRGGDSNMNSGGGSNGSNTQQTIGRDSNAISGGGSNGSITQQAIGRDSNAISGGGSDRTDFQQAIGWGSNAIGGGEYNANSGEQSAANASGLAALELRDPARKACRTAVVYDRYTRDAINRYSDRYDEAAARVTVLELEVADSRQRVIYLQELGEEGKGDHPPAQLAIDDQELIDGLKRRLFNKPGDCTTLEAEARRL
jgi:hypothetical protein